MHSTDNTRIQLYSNNLAVIWLIILKEIEKIKEWCSFVSLALFKCVWNAKICFLGYENKDKIYPLSYKFK